MNRSTAQFPMTYSMLIVSKNYFIYPTNIFILFERQITVVYVAFYLVERVSQCTRYLSWFGDIVSNCVLAEITFSFDV